jgi:hypothetical protein
MSKREGFFFCLLIVIVINYLFFLIKFFKITVCVTFQKGNVYMEVINMSIDGMKIWLDLTKILLKMKYKNCYPITGVKVIVNELEIKQTNMIPNANLDSVTVVCSLGEPGVLFFF